jgi:4-hydroxybenzoate polyprenyltransferase
MTTDNLSWKDLLRFIRWPNLVLIILFLLIFDHVVVGFAVRMTGLETRLDDLTRVLLVLDVLIVTVFGYAVNDLRDRTTDSVNRPDRLLVKRPDLESKIRGMVIFLAGMGFVLSLLLAYLLDRLAWIWIYPLVLFLLDQYAKRGKHWGFAGNALVSFLIAALPSLWIIADSDVFVTLIDQYPQQGADLLELMLGFGGLMFLTNLVREMVKDVEDLQGDQQIRSKTLPAVIGVSGTKGFVVVGLILTTLVQFGLVWVLPRSLVLSGFSMLVFLVLLILMRWVQMPSFDMKARRVSNGLKLLMLIGLMELFFLPSTLG